MFYTSVLTFKKLISKFTLPKLHIRNFLVAEVLETGSHVMQTDHELDIQTKLILNP